MRNHETGQEAEVQGQGTEKATEIIGDEVAAGVEKGMAVIETGTIGVKAEAEAEAEAEAGAGAKAEVQAQALTTKVAVEQEMMISARAGARVGAEAEAGVEVQVLTTKVIVEQEMVISARAGAEVGVEAAHTIVVHLISVVSALTRAHRHRGAPLLKNMPMEKIHLCHAVFLHHQNVQAPVAQAVIARNKAY